MISFHSFVSCFRLFLKDPSLLDDELESIACFSHSHGLSLALANFSTLALEWGSVTRTLYRIVSVTLSGCLGQHHRLGQDKPLASTSYIMIPLFSAINSFLFFGINPMMNRITIHAITATWPLIPGPPATARASAVAAAAATPANPKLWQKAAPTKGPKKVTAESEEPWPASTSCLKGHPPAGTAANPTAYMPRIFQICWAWARLSM